MLRDGIISKIVIPQKSNVSVYIDEVVYSLPVKIGQNSDNFLKLMFGEGQLIFWYSIHPEDFLMSWGDGKIKKNQNDFFLFLNRPF